MGSQEELLVVLKDFCHNQAIGYLQAKNAELSAENERLRVLLNKYGRHNTACNYAGYKSFPCNCGFAAALSPDVPESEEE